MNRRLRVRHRWTITLLALAVPLVLVAGITARPPLPLMENLPALDRGDGDGFETRFAEAVIVDVVIGAATIRASLYVSDDQPSRYAVQVAPANDRAVAAGDVLLYWARETSNSVGTSVPPNAYFLGALAGLEVRRFDLPAAAMSDKGRLLFFSLAEQRLLAESDVLSIRVDSQ